MGDANGSADPCPLDHSHHLLHHKHLHRLLYNHAMFALSKARKRWCRRLSIVTAAALLIIWIGSRWWWYGGSIATTGTSVVACAGRIDVIISDRTTPVHAPGWLSIERHRVPFAYGFDIGQPRPGITRIIVPLWSLTILAALPYVFCRAVDWRARRLGRCINCGYDMRGTLANRCPECGAFGD